MLRRLALCVLVLGVAGCDVRLSDLRVIKWATVDKHALRSALQEVVKAENPYPDGVADIEERRVEYAQVRQQISILEGEIKESCRRKTAPMPAFKLDGTGRIDPAFQAEMQRRGEATDDYRRCLIQIQNDQLINDLRAKISGYEKLSQMKSTHDREVAKKVEARVESLVAAYAESKGFDLVIAKDSNSVLYDKNNMVLDVTSGVLEIARQ